MQLKKEVKSNLAVKKCAAPKKAIAKKHEIQGDGQEMA